MKSLYETIFDQEASLENVVVKPHSKKELDQIINNHIKRIGLIVGGKIDLNWIDISGVDDLSYLFQDTLYIPVIDKWKIDQVKDFGYMFSGNEYITRSPFPVLQEKLKDRWCYSLMFYDCKNLKEPPVLPATELTEGCYSGMFFGCTSLETAPELPAMKLQKRCYGRMFQNCTSLEVAPELPAMELKENCYWRMFKGCSKLKARAKVPAGVSLDGYTALDMYDGCRCRNIKKYK